jgi:hypothetical protein
MMRRCLAVGALGVAGLLAAGCSSGPTGGGGHPGTPVAANAAGASDGGFGPKLARLIVFAGCMRTHGVPGFPEPIAQRNGKPVFAVRNGSGVNQNSPQFRRADQACRSLLSGLGGAQITAQDQVDYLRAAQCMRAHGVPDFPDPVFASGAVRFPLPASLDIHTPQVQRAVAICRTLIPRGLPYSR